MTIHNWLIYSFTALLNILSPGPAILLAISNSLTIGPRAGVFATLGNALGLLLLSSAAVLGLGTLLHGSPMLFAGLKTTGAAYLVYLGARKWRARGGVFSGPLDSVLMRSRSPREVFGQGFWLAATNPKPILFFTALFPQFMALDKPALPQFAILTFTFITYSFSSLTTYALLAHSIRDWLREDRNFMFVNRLTGATFVLLGIGMLGYKGGV